MGLEVGQVFAGYTILRVLGAGGMGQVYLATHPRLPREDALKVLPRDLTANPEYRGRFVREAELAAALSHPHIVGIHDRGEQDGQFWISMDYVAGTDVGQLLHSQFPGGMPVDQAVPIIAAVASALDYAHHRGLLHRDVKPANILLSNPDGQAPRAFLADFGIARRIDDSTGLTATNMTVGTAAYAAPEQLKAQSIDGRADQYALACTAFHMLTGAPPYVHSNPAVVITRHVTSPPPSIGACRPELAGLDSVFAKAMAKEPSRRFASCQEFAEHLAHPRDAASYNYETNYETQPVLGVATTVLPLPSPPKKKRRSRLLISALAVIALLIAGGVFAGMKLTQPQKPAVAPGPFTGTYKADFGPIIGIDDIPDPAAAPAVTGTYGLRSLCRSTGCVMTASRLGNVPVGQPTLVFDQVGGGWVAVALSSEQCLSKAAEYWQVFRLQPRPDGTLAGVYIETSPSDCANKRTVTFTRTGDVDVNRLPDPAGQPPRVVSPAEALRGRYRVSKTFPNGDPKIEADTAVTTNCLRTGDECISYFHGQSGDMPLVFGGGKWTFNLNGDGTCLTAGDPMHVISTAVYPLPQPPQNPITLLTGHGHIQQTGSCAANADFDQTFTRTGD
jgi:serine/threonine protein kinase